VRLVARFGIGYMPSVLVASRFLELINAVQG
jgi:hypothetical protein